MHRLNGRIRTVIQLVDAINTAYTLVVRTENKSILERITINNLCECLEIVKRLIFNIYNIPIIIRSIVSFICPEDIAVVFSYKDKKPIGIRINHYTVCMCFFNCRSLWLSFLQVVVCLKYLFPTITTIFCIPDSAIVSKWVTASVSGRKSLIAVNENTPIIDTISELINHRNCIPIEVDICAMGYCRKISTHSIKMSVVVIIYRIETSNGNNISPIGEFLNAVYLNICHVRDNNTINRILSISCTHEQVICGNIFRGQRCCSV